MKYITNSPEETFDLGVKYAKTLNKNDVVLLQGQMGAGKTLFAKGVAKGLNIKANITSPTYAYMNDYDGILYHYDCYRLSCGENALQLGLTDYFDAGGICLIEWSDNIASVLPEKTKTVTIKVLGDKREITL